MDNVDSQGEARVAARVAALIERIGRSVDADAHGSGLLPVQWEVLRYLDRANRFSRNSSALAAYLGSTKGTVSQTLKALERRGLIRARVDSKDRRRRRLSLTAQGRRFLAGDPLAEMSKAATDLPPGVCSSLAEGLEILLRRRLDTADRPPFGRCRECAYFAAEHAAGRPHFCRLLKEPLSPPDSRSICVEQVAG